MIGAVLVARMDLDFPPGSGLGGISSTLLRLTRRAVLGIMAQTPHSRSGAFNGLLGAWREISILRAEGS